MHCAHVHPTQALDALLPHSPTQWHPHFPGLYSSLQNKGLRGQLEERNRERNRCSSQVGWGSVPAAAAAVCDGLGICWLPAMGACRNNQPCYTRS